MHSEVLNLVCACTYVDTGASTVKLIYHTILFFIQKADYYRGAPPAPPISTLRRRRTKLVAADEGETEPLTYECDVEAEEECAEKIEVCHDLWLMIIVCKHSPVIIFKDTVQPETFAFFYPCSHGRNLYPPQFLSIT